MIYTITLGKGGTGKSTTAAELVAELVRQGRKVLALDLDRQGNFTSRMGVTRDTEVYATTAQVLVGDVSVQDAAIEAPTVPGAHVVPGNHELAEVDNRSEIVAGLRAGLAKAGEWDDIVIDTPPALGVINQAAIAAAGVIVAPVSCDAEAWEQVAQLDLFIQGRVSKPLHLDGVGINWIIPTKHRSQRLLDREVIEMLREKWGDHVTPPIRESVVVKDSYVAGQPVGLYAPSHDLVADYRVALAQITQTH